MQRAGAHSPGLVLEQGLQQVQLELGQASVGPLARPLCVQRSQQLHQTACTVGHMGCPACRVPAGWGPCPAACRSGLCQAGAGTSCQVCALVAQRGSKLSETTQEIGLLTLAGRSSIEEEQVQAQQAAQRHAATASIQITAQSSVTEVPERTGAGTQVICIGQRLPQSCMQLLLLAGAQAQQLVCHSEQRLCCCSLQIVLCVLHCSPAINNASIHHGHALALAQ